VTGSGQGIGQGIAVALAKKGANVVLADISDSIFEVAEQIKAAGSLALPAKCDVTNSKSVETTMKKVLDEFGRVDILINNAGIYPFKQFVEMAEQDWDRVFHVNLKGIFHCTKSALPTMINQRFGKIVNISSIAGTIIGYQNLVHYSATKAGIVGFTRSLALEVAKNGINVNAIAPGAIETPTSKAAMDAMPKELAEQTVRAIPLGRLGTAKDIGNTVLFLVGEESSYITGQCIIVDGGLTIQ
jgi:3-oxoacyl-[acyl-carrier protein] reductase